jgi:hypothetical protein
MKALEASWRFTPGLGLAPWRAAGIRLLGASVMAKLRADIPSPELNNSRQASSCKTSTSAFVRPAAMLMSEAPAARVPRANFTEKFWLSLLRFCVSVPGRAGIFW